MGDRLGRRRTIILGAVLMIIGAILQTASVDYPMMIVARIVTGLGNGLNVRRIRFYSLRPGVNSKYTDVYSTIVSCRVFPCRKSRKLDHDGGCPYHFWYHGLVSVVIVLRLQVHFLTYICRYWVDFACFWAKSSSAQWRVPIALQILFALILIVTIRWVGRIPFSNACPNLI